MNTQYLQRCRNTELQTQLSMTVNVVFVLDRTGSMRRFAAQAKKRVKDMYSSIQRKCEEKGRMVSALNACIADFGDVNYEKDWISLSPVFHLSEGSEQVEAFRKYVDGIRIHGGGGDGPESGLEALSAVIHSYDLSSDADRTRTVYVILTDAPAHPLHSAANCGWYPAYAEQDLAGLYAAWLDVQGRNSPRSKRMVIFAPDVYPWREISDTWVQVNFRESVAGAGLGDVDMDSIFSFIADSI